jgi:hypothetical protein
VRDPLTTNPVTSKEISRAEPGLAEHAAAIRALGKQTVENIIEIGRRLSECKRICGHGNWLPWLDREFGWSDQTARNFMRVAELSKSKTVLNLDLPVKALYQLAAPSTPKEARDTIIERAKSAPVPVAEVKRIIETTKDRRRLAKKSPTELIWKEEQETYTAEDYALVPGINAFSGSKRYGIYQGKQPEMPDRREVGNRLSLKEAKAVAQRDFDARVKAREKITPTKSAPAVKPKPRDDIGPNSAGEAESGPSTLKPSHDRAAQKLLNHFAEAPGEVQRHFLEVIRDIGPASASEIEHKNERIAELEREKRRLEFQIGTGRAGIAPDHSRKVGRAMTRLADDLVREAVDLLAAHGFDPAVRNGGKHLKISWIDYGRRYTLVLSRSPSDHRARAKSRALLQRLLRGNVTFNTEREMTMVDIASTIDRDELERSIKAISDDIANITAEIFALQEKLDELKWHRIDLRSVLHGG